MEARYQTLQTIYNITQQDSHPASYLCRPREIILRQFQDWSIIQQHLKLLEQDGFVVTKQLDTLVITITEAGIEKISSKNFDYHQS